MGLSIAFAALACGRGQQDKSSRGPFQLVLGDFDRMQTPHNASRKRPLLDAPETPAGGAGPVTPSSGIPRHLGASHAHELWSGAKTVANKAVGRVLNLNSSSPSAEAAGSPYAHAVGGCDDQSPGAVRASRPPLQLDYDETASKACEGGASDPPCALGTCSSTKPFKREASKPRASR